MNISKIHTKTLFPSVESKINRGVTFMLQITFWGIFILFFCLFVMGPAYGIYNKGTKTMLSVALICRGFSLLILISVIQYYMIKRKNIASKIVVDNTGLLFYNLKNEIVKQVLYTELRPSKQNFDIYTVTPVGSSIVPLLEVTVQQEKKDEEIRHIDMNLPLRIVKNKFTLYAHFMRGITAFRPDLKIDPMVFKSFSIDPDTWKVNSKGVSSGGWLLILVALATTGFILGFVFYYLK